MIVKIFNPEPRKKMAGFDFHWTIAKPRSNPVIYQNVNDWEYMNKYICFKLKQLYLNNFMIVVFVDYCGELEKNLIQTCLYLTKIPCYLVIPKNSLSLNKPNIELFDYFIDFIREYENIPNFYIDVSKSFYMGDAMGRSQDWDNYDKLFAERIGITYFYPEQIMF